MNPTQFDLKLSICPAVWNALQTTSLRGHRGFPEVVLFDSAIAAVGRVRNRSGPVHPRPLLSECVSVCLLLSY